MLQAPCSSHLPRGKYICLLALLCPRPCGQSCSGPWPKASIARPSGARRARRSRSGPKECRVTWVGDKWISFLWISSFLSCAMLPCLCLLVPRTLRPSIHHYFLRSCFSPFWSILFFFSFYQFLYIYILYSFKSFLTLSVCSLVCSFLLSDSFCFFSVASDFLVVSF